MRSRSRSRPAAASSRRRTGTRRTCSRRVRARLVPFDDAAALADAVVEYVEQPETLAAARAEARRVGSSLAWPSVAEATARRPARGARARAAPQAGRRRRPAAHEPAHRPRAHARRRRRHRAARARDHPEPRQRLLRRRRRPPRGRLARARAPRRRAGVDVDPLPGARVPARSGGRGRDAQLHELRPELARRAAHGRPRRAHGLRRSARSSRRRGSPPSSTRRASCSAGSSARSRATSRCAPPPTRCSASRASTPTASIRRRDACSSASSEQLADAYERNASDEWSWFEDEAHATTTRASRRRSSQAAARSAATTSSSLGLESLRWLGDESGLRRRHAAPDGPSRTPRATSRPRAAATSSRSMPPRSSRPSSTAFAVTRDAEHGVRARRAFEWFLGRNHLQRPLYDFATGGCSDGLGSEALNANEGAESTLAFHRAALLLDADRRPRRRSREPAVRRERARALHAPSRQPDPDRRGLAVSGQRRLQPGGRRARRRDRPARAGRGPHGDLASHRRAFRERRRRLGRSTRSRCSRPRPASRASSGASRTPRVVWIAELERWVITCTAYGPAGPAVYLATTEDFRTVERYGIVRQPEDKNAALLPYRIDGRWVLLHRPKTEFGGARGEILLSRSDGPRQLERARAGAAAARRRVVGLAAASASGRRRFAPSTAGCSSTTASSRPCRGDIYRVGLALLDLDEPTRVLHRLPEWILGPLAAVRARRRRAERRLPLRARARRRDRRGAPLLRRRRQLHLPRDRAARPTCSTPCSPRRPGRGSTRPRGLLDEARRASR